jgi:methyl-accepting chemotaxis protein
MKSISFRLIAAMLTICFIGMGLVASIGTVLAGKNMLEQSIGKVGETTAFEAERINSWFLEQTRYISAIGSDLENLPNATTEELRPMLLTHLNRNSQFFDVYLGYPDGTSLFAGGWVPDYSVWHANERGWYKGAVSASGKPFITSPYTDSQTGNLCTTVAQAIIRDNVVVEVVAADIFIDTLQEIISGIDVGQDSYAFLTDSEGNILIHPNAAYGPNSEDVFQNLTAVDNGIYTSLVKGNSQSEAIQLRDASGTARYYTARNISAVNWTLYTAVPQKLIWKPIYQQIIAAAIVFIAVLFIAAIMIYLITRSIIVKPVNDVTVAAGLLAHGDTAVRLTGSYVGEIGQLAESFLNMEHSTKEQVDILESISDGDLTVAIKKRGDSDRMNAALHKLLDNFNDMFARLRSNADNVASASRQIASNSQGLAQGASEQASSIRQLSDSVSDIAEKTAENSRKAIQAASLSDLIHTNAQKGSDQMNQMVQAVREIGEASDKISKVINVIDDIAFQTNILALNASVEAARAGQHGKGFAVVAEEVRSLAAKSAEAAQNTSVLITDSVSKASLGVRLAGETSTSLSEIVSGIRESAALINDIAASSQEQSSAIREINTGIDRVTQVVSQNSAAAEQSAAAADEMSTQSVMLNDLITHFHLK